MFLLDCFEYYQCDQGTLSFDISLRNFRFASGSSISELVFDTRRRLTCESVGMCFQPLSVMFVRCI